MVYLQEDFYTTLAGEKDVDKKRKMLLSEISYLIVSDKPQVIEALNASGILTKQTASDKQVIDAIADNIGKNAKLQAGVAYMIAVKNTDAEQTSGQDAKVGISDPVSTIIGGVTNAIGAIFGSKAAKTQAEAQADANRAALAAQVMAARQPKSNTGLYLGLAALGVAAIVLVVYLTRKKY